MTEPQRIYDMVDFVECDECDTCAHRFQPKDSCPYFEPDDKGLIAEDTNTIYCLNHEEGKNI